MIRLFVASILATLLCAGCAGNKVILHPIEDYHIAVMKKDVPYSPKTDGYFFSKKYVDEVMDAKIDYSD